ncbi:helix-turn-helix transcriptional regulator [Amycolatopsis minnesotensis]|uniref:HTH cro/C1-type domain-containing protein n=1 Tax=Amycolatopsis minnesotensis TaxID=337894 RepID=A0ABP5E9S9_9PSEU
MAGPLKVGQLQLVLLAAEDVVARNPRWAALCLNVSKPRPPPAPVNQAATIALLTSAEASGTLSVPLGARIKQARLHAGITRAALAHTSGYSEVLIRQIEVGRRAVTTVPLVVGLTAGLQVPLDQFTALAIEDFHTRGHRYLNNATHSETAGT